MTIEILRVQTRKERYTDDAGFSVKLSEAKQSRSRMVEDVKESCGRQVRQVRLERVDSDGRNGLTEVLLLEGEEYSVEQFYVLEVVVDHVVEL